MATEHCGLVVADLASFGGDAPEILFVTPFGETLGEGPMPVVALHAAVDPAQADRGSVESVVKDVTIELSDLESQEASFYGLSHVIKFEINVGMTGRVGAFNIYVRDGQLSAVNPPLLT